MVKNRTVPFFPFGSPGSGYGGGYGNNYVPNGYSDTSPWSDGSEYYSDTGYGSWGSHLDITNRYNNYRKRLEIEDWYWRSSYKDSSKNIDVVDVTLGGISSISSLVALGSPVPQVKLGAGIVGVAATGGSVLYSIYQYKQGEISRNEMALSIALDVTPMFGKGAARIVSKKIYEAVGGGFDVIEHQIGTGEVIYETIIKPTRGK